MFWYDASLSHLPSPIINLLACQQPSIPYPHHFICFSPSLSVHSLSPCSPHCAAVIWYRAAAGCHLSNSIQSLSNTWDTKKLKGLLYSCQTAQVNTSDIHMLQQHEHHEKRKRYLNMALFLFGVGAHGNLHFNIYTAKVLYESQKS